MLTFAVNYSLISIGYHFRNERLTWNNAVPENEVHKKLGGDAGGGSFKMALQIANLRRSGGGGGFVRFSYFMYLTCYRFALF